MKESNAYSLRSFTIRNAPTRNIARATIATIEMLNFAFDIREFAI